METFICNKCFSTPHRGKKPFCLTQCGHIFCHGCIQKAEKECPECRQMDFFSVELQQPSLSKVENFFAPINESLESMAKVSGFQNNQMKIMAQRFHVIDKKYETLKSHYFNLSQNMKLMKDKYIKLKMENAEQRMKLKSFEANNRNLHSSMDTCTPISSNDPRNTRSTTNTYFSTGSANMSCQTFNVEKRHTMFEGFRMPHPKTANTSSTYTFRH